MSAIRVTTGDILPAPFNPTMSFVRAGDTITPGDAAVWHPASKGLFPGDHFAVVELANLPLLLTRRTRVRQFPFRRRAIQFKLRPLMMRDIASYRTRLQDEAQAEKYAARFERGSRARIDRREQRAVKKIFAGLPDCRSVLDVPCGAGRFAQTLGEGGRHMLGVDSAREILAHAQKRALRFGVRAQFIHGDASKLPFPDDAVDAVFCNRLLHHLLKLEERAAILSELRRVSRRYVVVSFFDYQGFAVVRRLLKTLKGSKPKYAGQPTREQFEREISACGLRVRELVPVGAAWVSQKYFVLEKI